MKRLGIGFLAVIALAGCGGASGGSAEAVVGRQVQVGLTLIGDVPESSATTIEGVEVPYPIEGESAVLADKLSRLVNAHLSDLGGGTWTGKVQVVVNSQPTDPVNNYTIETPVVVNGTVQTFIVGSQSLSFKQYLAYRFLNPPNGFLNYTSVVLVLRDGS